MGTGNPVLPSSTPAGSEATFRSLLLSISHAASEGRQKDSLLQFFCRASREAFGASGVYLWRTVAGELIGAEADGHLAEQFRGLRLRPDESAVAADAIRQRRAVYVNHLEGDRYPIAARFQARSLLAAPLITFGEVTGVLAILHVSDPAFATDELAAKATILAGQMGSLLEASRLNLESREEHRRATILMEFARALPSAPGGSAVVEALADRLRSLLRAPAVCVLFRQDTRFILGAASGETPALAETIRERYRGGALACAEDLAQRALAAGEPISVAMTAESHQLTDVAPAGVLLAVPFRTSRSSGAVLIYPRAESAFTAEDRSLVSAITGFGAVAMANAELYHTASGQAQELHDLLEISCELSGAADVEQFLSKFAVRATDFLGFRRSFIGLVEGERCEVQFAAEGREVRRVHRSFPVEKARKVLIDQEAFWSNDLQRLPMAGVHSDVAGPEVRQILAVPLLGTEGQALGMFGVLERVDGEQISAEDVRRAQALAAQISVGLELTRNLQAAQQHRRRAEALISLALELGSLLQVPAFARSFTLRAADLLNAREVVLLLANGPQPLEVAGWHPPAQRDGLLASRLGGALGSRLRESAEPVISGAATDILQPGLAAALQWDDLTMTRLQGPDGEIIGALALTGLGKDLAEPVQQMLKAVASFAGVALQNAQLFTRMERSNRHWVEVFDAISDFILVHDEARRVLRVNRSLADFIGVRPQELIGLSAAAVLAEPTSLPATDCPFCRAVSDGVDEFLHSALERTFLVSTSRIHAPAHEGLQTIHVLKDITDRREAERRYRELFDNIQEGLYFSTPEGRFIEVNEALVRMLGYDSREELLGAEISRQIYFTEDQRERFRQQLEAGGSVRNYQETLRRKDGTPVHTLQNAFAVRDSQGRVVQFRGLMLDITGLRGFQAELQRERDFSGKILDNTQSLILVVDAGGLITYANRRWADVGYEWKQLLNRPMEELAVAPRRPVLREALEATLAGHPINNLELPLMRGDGVAGQFSLNLSPMRDEHGHLASLVAVVTDITESSMLQAKLMHTEKMAAVGQLVSGVAHEVNNPLTAILGFADLLMENPDLPETARGDLRVILQEAQRTRQIVQNLLSFARQMPPQRKPVQINAILQRTLQLRAYDFQSHGVEVIENLAQSLPEVVGDAQQLQQVFLNILNNAYDAVREVLRPARIEITTAWSRGVAEVSFRDNGNGIVSPERIFDPFFTTKEVGKGTGLGLSICYGIVREHGGEILCHNNSDAPGATFVVRLPLAEEGASLGATAGGEPR